VHRRLVIFSCYAGCRYPHSFPTRRSSDLSTPMKSLDASQETLKAVGDTLEADRFFGAVGAWRSWAEQYDRIAAYHFAAILFSPRSEEHTSELQSRENLVCRLLLEKKKRRI